MPNCATDEDMVKYDAEARFHEARKENSHRTQDVRHCRTRHSFWDIPLHAARRELAHAAFPDAG